MSDEFEESLIEEFCNFDPNKISVILSKHHIFLCGGIIDVKEPIPPSFRDRFVDYIAKNNNQINDALILAENFKDYFKENYTDLLVFEDEIANLSTLVDSVAIFAKACFGHPSPSKRQKLNATN